MAFDLQRNNIGFATKMMVTTNPRILRPFSAWKLTSKRSGIMLFCYKHNFEWLMIIFLIYLIDYNLIGLIQPFNSQYYSFPFIFELYLLFWIEMCPDQLLIISMIDLSIFLMILEIFTLKKSIKFIKSCLHPKALICNIFIKIKENELNARFCCISIPSIIQLVHFNLY